MPSIISQSIQTQFLSENKSGRFPPSEVQPQALLVKNIKNSKALNVKGL